MTEIPFEILALIFKPLKSKDLKQCQLVCRSWNQASLEILYSEVKLNSEKECQLYVRTIKRAPQLGKYLKIIEARIEYICDTEEDTDCEDLVEYVQYNNWDRHDLLDTVIDLCPNVLKILNNDPSMNFWTTLMGAALRGRLSRLQYVPSPRDNNFYDYNLTAFGFEKTLNTLKLTDSIVKVFLTGEKLHPEDLNQFPCLVNLEIDYYSKHQPSYYDTIIDYCEGLTSLIIHPAPNESQLIIAEAIEGIIKPHPKIESLKCTLYIENAEDQVAYIIRKFPNLKSLTVECDWHGSNGDVQFSVNTLLKLLRFGISLKKIVASVTLNLEDYCINPWITLINEEFITIDITISIMVYSEDHNDPESVQTYFTGKSLTFYFSSFTDHHIKLLSEIGKKVRSLTIRIRTPDYVTKIDQITQMIKLCPSLQHLNLQSLLMLLYSDSIDYQNFELETLTLSPYNYPTIGSLEKLLFIFPNLKKLELSFPDQYDVNGTVTIDMPNTNLDILRCSVANDFFGSVTVFYIRLKSDAGLQFFSATTSEVRQVNEDKHRHLHFDINCRSLAKIKIDEIVWGTSNE